MIEAFTGLLATAAWRGEFFSELSGMKVAQVFNLGEVRAKRLRLAELKEMLGELFHRVVIPPTYITEEALDYIFPAAIMRGIDELSLSELDDLLKGDLKFFILK